MRRRQHHRRHAFIALVALAISLTPLVAHPVRGAIPARAATLGPDSPSFAWDGPSTLAAHPFYETSPGAACGGSAPGSCDATLLYVGVDPSFWGTVSGGVEVRVCTPVCTAEAPRAAADFDLYVYGSDENGTRGDLLVSSAQHPSKADEKVSVPQASGYYLVEVVAFAMLERAHYHAEASFTEGGLWPVTLDGTYTPLPVETFYVPTRAGQVFVRLQRPAVAEGVKVPVLLNFSPYNNTPLDQWDSQAYVDNGYAAAVADVPGTGNSGGCWDAFGPLEQAAGHDLVEALATKKWSNGKVGMHGFSAIGTTPIMTAASRPPHLATIASFHGLSSLYDAVYHDGLRYAEGDPAQFNGGGPTSTALSVLGITALPAGDPLGADYAERATRRICPDTSRELFERLHQQQPVYDDFWRDREWVEEAGRLAEPSPDTGTTVSSLTVGGWRDPLLKPPQQTNWFKAVPDGPFKMLVMDKGGHASGSSAAAVERFVLEKVLHAWFDHFLYGFETGVTDLSPVWSVGNSGRSINKPHPFDEKGVSWPPAAAEEVKLFLAGSGNATGSLALKPPKGAHELGTWTDPGTVTESEVVLWRHDFDAADAKDFLWFETGELSRDIRIAGTPRLELLASTSATSTHFTPVLFDLGPTAPDDYLRVGSPCTYPSKRDGAEQKHFYCAVARGFLNARYTDGIDHGIDLRPDQPYRASIRFLDQDWTVPAGHRIGLALMSSNTWWATPDEQRATNTIFTATGRRSALVIPVEGGEPALASALVSD